LKTTGYYNVALPETRFQKNFNYTTTITLYDIGDHHQIFLPVTEGRLKRDITQRFFRRDTRDVDIIALDRDQLETLDS